MRHPAPAPDLPPDFQGETTSDNSSQLGIEEFYQDPMLTCLIEKALVDNRELRSLNEEVQVASNEVLARSGAYLPFISVAAGTGLERVSRFSLDGAAILNDPFLPGRFFSNPRGIFNVGLNYTWQLDVYRQLRNARDAAGQRYVSAAERRNFFVTQLVADIADDYYRLMSLDKRIDNLNQIIELQQRSLEIAELSKQNARGTELGVLRFQAELQRNQSEKLIINQDIIETENRINYAVNRYPQPVQRNSAEFFDLMIHPISVGVPSELLQNRPDIRQSERDLMAAGLDVKVARVNFYPQFVISGGTGLDAQSLRYLFEPQAIAGSIAGGLVAPFVNRRSIRAQYMTANARQLQAVYSYQRVILNAFTEVFNRLMMVRNYTGSIDLKRQQLTSLEKAVEVANTLYQATRIEYLDVLTAQRDLRDARTALIDTKLSQLSAIVNAYQALGGGVFSITMPPDFRGQFPYMHTVRAGENFWTISLLYYRSGRYCKALWAANQRTVPGFDQLKVGDQLVIPPVGALDPALVAEVPGPPPALADDAAGPAPAMPSPNPAPAPADPNAPAPATTPPPAANAPGPFTDGDMPKPQGGLGSSQPPAPGDPDAPVLTPAPPSVPVGN